MDITLHLDDHHACCEVSDILDGHNASDLRRVTDRLEGVPRVLFDLTELRAIDHDGINALVCAVRRVRRTGGEIVVACPPGPVRDVFHLVGFDRIVDVSDSVATGLLRLMTMGEAESSDAPAAIHETV